MTFATISQSRPLELYNNDNKLDELDQYSYHHYGHIQPRSTPSNDNFAYANRHTLTQHQPWIAGSLPDAVGYCLDRSDTDRRSLSCWSEMTTWPTHSSSSGTRSLRDDRSSTPFEHEVPALSPDYYPPSLEPECHDHVHMFGHNATVAMVDVHHFVDSPSDYSLLDADLGLSSQYFPQEGYQPMRAPMVDTPMTSYDETPHFTLPTQNTPSVSSPDSPVLRQRRQAARAHSHKTQATRVSKRPHRRAVASPADSESETDQSPTRPFHCPLAPYGCSSTFGSKNEWKRHLSTQHLRLEYWRCDQCPTSHGKRPNDFNRRDLFTQHVRRMHAQATNTAARRGRGKVPRPDAFEQHIQDAASRCNVKLRAPPPKSICVICRQSFTGPGSWEERMEHIGKHFESAKRDGANINGPTLDVEAWCTDTDVEMWMVKQGILTEHLELGSMVDESRE